MVSRRDDLDLMRVKLVAAMGDVDAKDLPRVTKELRAVNAELESLAPPVTAGQQTVDELKEKRARRRRSAAQG